MAHAGKTKGLGGAGRQWAGTLWPLLPLAAAIILSLYTHSIVLSEFVAPTFGNTGIHVAAERHFVEKGTYPLEDYSYGGGIPNIYVPVYRAAVAEVAWLTAWDFDFINRAIVMLFAAILPLGFFALGRRLFGTTAGLFAAFFTALPAELLIYTVRPLPQAMGLVLLPLAFLLVFRAKPFPALLFSFAITLVHQEAALFFAGGAFAYGAAGAALNFARREKIDKRFILSLACWLVAVVTYLAWHFSMTGTIAFWELAQFKHHEGNVMEFGALMEKTGWVAPVLGVLGAIIAAAILFAKAAKTRQDAVEGSAAGNAAGNAARDAALFGLVLFAAGIVLVKNDLVGLRVFMDRFLVYLQQPMLLLAGLGAAKLVDCARDIGNVLKQRK